MHCTVGSRVVGSLTVEGHTHTAHTGARYPIKALCVLNKGCSSVKAIHTLGSPPLVRMFEGCWCYPRDARPKFSGGECWGTSVRA